jgi:hypothetical protein
MRETENTKAEENGDRILWGCAEIATVAEVIKKDGSGPDIHRMYNMLEGRHVDATKVGKYWCSTPNRIRRSLGVL